VRIDDLLAIRPVLVEVMNRCSGIDLPSEEMGPIMEEAEEARRSLESRWHDHSNLMYYLGSAAALIQNAIYKAMPAMPSLATMTPGEIATWAFNLHTNPNPWQKSADQLRRLAGQLHEEGRYFGRVISRNTEYYRRD
jgi:hypothetical protein